MDISIRVTTAKTRTAFFTIGIVTAIVVSLTLSSAYAETVILKSGKTVEGKIIEKTGEYVRLNFCGVDLKYYLEEIASIDEKPIKTEPLPQPAAQPQPEEPFPVDTTPKESFENNEWGYSLQYPSLWTIMPAHKIKKVMLMGLEPDDSSLVTLQLQAGNWSEEDTKGKSSIADLIDGFLKPHPDLRRESVKPITLRYESGYLIRFSYKTVEVIDNAKGIEGPLYVPVKVIFDYYLFSPVFSSQGTDRRSFLIEVSYIEYQDVSTQVDSVKNRTKMYEWNSYYRNENRKTEAKCWEAREIINSFRFSDKLP
ncbi:MAG: hypothetical protein PHV55_06055 [Candidatus Omnitrophica bacterium]|nr:hypothetical protein [Candidatus Omnitrophota bacterium]